MNNMSSPKARESFLKFHLKEFSMKGILWNTIERKRQPGKDEERLMFSSIHSEFVLLQSFFDSVPNPRLFAARELQPANRKVDIVSTRFRIVERTKNLESPSEGSSIRKRLVVSSVQRWTITVEPNWFEEQLTIEFDTISILVWSNVH